MIKHLMLKKLFCKSVSPDCTAMRYQLWQIKFAIFACAALVPQAAKLMVYC